MAIDAEELAVMNARLGLKIKFHQEKLQKLNIISQRMNLVNDKDPKDQFGEPITQPDIEKHFNKTKTAFDKIIPKQV